jgi:hypothetical protein
LDVSKFDFHAEWNRSKQVIVKYISRSNIDIWKVSVIIVVDYLMNMDNDDRIARSAMNCLFSVRTFFLWKSEYVTIEKKISMEWRTAAENWLLHHHRQHWFLLSSSYELSGNRKKERKNKMTHTHTHICMQEDHRCMYIKADSISMDYYCYCLNNSYRWDTYHHSYRSDISLYYRDISKYMIIKRREEKGKEKKRRMKGTFGIY